MRGKNARGPIAASYEDLQSIDLLKRAWASVEVPAHSPASSLRTVLQAVELLMLSLTDLTTRMAVDLRESRWGAASVKATWCSAFHRLATGLGVVAAQVAVERADKGQSLLGFNQSPALATYVESLRELESVCAPVFEREVEALSDAVASRSGDDERVRLLHHLSIGYHEARYWEKALNSLGLNGAWPDYATFVDSPTLTAASHALEIEGDTFLPQFRCLHQIPELLSFEANEHLAAATLELRDASGEGALRSLTAANDLVSGIVAAMAALTDTLVLADYHDIRANLGVTSGSHSISIRYHLGRDLYHQLSGELVAATKRRFGAAPGASEFPPAAGMPNDPTWLALVREGLRLRLLLAQWRQWHLHLPRANLGANMTRSLAGSPDAVNTATLMRDEAARDDGLTLLARAFGCAEPDAPGPLSLHLQSATSLDLWILKLKGAITQARFVDVQHRAGYFATPGRFVVPPKRHV